MNMAEERRAWRAWRLLAYGMGAAAVGHLARSLYYVGLGTTPAVSLAARRGVLTSSVLVVGGLLSMVSTPAGRLSHLRGAAEGLLIAAGCFLITWCTVIAAVFAERRPDDLGQIVNLAYPVLDTVALAGLLFVAVRSNEHLPAGLGLLALGIAFARHLRCCVLVPERDRPGISQGQPRRCRVGGGFPASSPLPPPSVIARADGPAGWRPAGSCPGCPRCRPRWVSPPRS